MEDAKALCILDQVIRHDGEVETSRLNQEIVKKQGAMSRSTFWEKLKLLVDEEKLLRREPRMKGNKSVTYIILAEPYLGIIRQGSSDQFAMLKSEAVERLTALEVSVGEKEEILERLLKEYMNDSLDWILDVMRECLKAENLAGVVRAPTISARYLFGWRLTTIGVLYWKFKAYGIGALCRFEEGLRSSREEVIPSVPGQRRGADAGEG